MTKTTSKFYIASISNRNPLDGLVGAKIACLGIHMTTHSGAGLGVVMLAKKPEVQRAALIWPLLLFAVEPLQLSQLQKQTPLCKC